ncbi:MAG: hypothetical protein K2K68_02285 [Duncaniella sp.]|nr:hypothetical protein [Duncaniella sp.]
MKTFASLLACVVAGCASLVAGCFVPVDGDRVRMHAVEWIEAPVRDADRPFDSSLPTVDITSLQVTGDFDINYYFVSDSVFCEQRPDSRREYLVKGDSVCLLSTESYDIIIRETVTPVWVADVATTSAIVRKALRHQREFFVGRGLMSQGVSGRCNVIIAPGDTLRDVSMHSVKTVCRYSTPRLIDEPEMDTPVDSALTFVEEITSWYARGCRYPIIQSWMSAVTDSAGTELYCARASAVVSPDELPFDPEATDDSLRDNDMQGYMPCAYDPSRLSVDTSGGDVRVSYEAGGDMEIEMILADIQGHVYAACARRRVGAGETYDFTVNRSALPPGDYVLYIYNGDERITEKLPLR